MTDTQIEDFARWLPDIVTVKTYDAFPPELWLIKEHRQVQPLEYLGLCHLVEGKLTEDQKDQYTTELLNDQWGSSNAVFWHIANATFDQRHVALKGVLG